MRVSIALATVTASVVLSTLLWLAPVQPAAAQGRQGRGGPAAGGGNGMTVFKATITPHWFANNTQFWYRNDLKGGATEFVLVNTEAQGDKRTPAFDHTKLAAALSKEAGKNYTADHLPFNAIDITNDDKLLRFTVDGVTWQCDLSTYACTKGGTGAVGDANDARPNILYFPDSDIADSDSPRPQDRFDLTSLTRQPATIWKDLTNASLEGPNSWINPAMASPLVPQAGTINTGEGEIQGPAQGQGRRGGFGGNAASPDGKWSANIVNYNIVLHPTAGGADIPLTTDGVANNYYMGMVWSRDSLGLVAARLSPGENKQVYYIQSSPPGQNGTTGGGVGRAVFQPVGYALPGDKFNNYELSVFDIANKKQIKPDVGLVDMTPDGTNPGFPNLDWYTDGIRFTYEKYDRGHQRIRLIEVNSHTGAVRNLIDDKADGKIQKFIWSANRDGIPTIPRFMHLNQNETIYPSEMDGWRHLYIADARPEKNTFKQIDKGDWILRGLFAGGPVHPNQDRQLAGIDTVDRVIWFTCGGVYPDQDRMFLHYGHVNFDGTNEVIMTAGNGTHTIAFSPDRKFIFDTYGSADQAPTTELRTVSDGKLVALLERAEVDGNWDHPELFCAKGRDGVTDIWGCISRPRNFDPTRKYPIIEDIYAGPQGTPQTLVPITFGTTSRNQGMLNLGFITVKMEAMGSFGGSKAFHDACWENLKDAGFPDRIAWIKAAAAKYPYMDITRVGIMGGSAGGQNTAAALLFHGDFYKVGVANSGCHDNRMDKVSWNEQWMGYPVGPQYAASSNIDNAGNLVGHLQLVVGELDMNVPPESTYRFVDALEKVHKDFEFVMVPGADHGAASPITGTKQNDFFVRYLQGVEPANHNLQAAGRGGAGRGAGGAAGNGAPGAAGAAGAGAGGN